MNTPLLGPGAYPTNASECPITKLENGSGNINLIQQALRNIFLGKCKNCLKDTSLTSFSGIQMKVSLDSISGLLGTGEDMRLMQISSQDFSCPFNDRQAGTIHTVELNKSMPVLEL